MITPPLNILYLVHDLTDATVHKRVRMLLDGGANVTLMGFYRRNTVPETLHGCPVIPMGHTYDGKFLHRIGAVLTCLLRIHTYRNLFDQSDIIMARTLEMLAIAVRGRSLFSQPPVLIYESLDIHRLLLNTGIIGKILRKLEGWLTKRASLVITSSPSFIHAYFQKMSSVACPVLLIENKVYESCKAPSSSLSPLWPEPPWRIGWFGAIRCRKSLAILKNLVTTMNGKVEVIIRGKPALDQFDDFYAETSGIQGLAYLGPYKNPDDLEKIYTDIHFTWAIDMFEEGLNSSWLLPNRIYEGGRYGCIPIAQSHVETGRTLARIGTGVRLDDPLPSSLLEFFQTLTPEIYTALKTMAESVPLSTWVMTKDDSTALVHYLSSLTKGQETICPKP